ncbi:hypothetical protein [Neisseria lactamica]|nr:hypothetical protein [Neisseria lactamica]
MPSENLQTAFSKHPPVSGTPLHERQPYQTADNRLIIRRQTQALP